jgi:hypothetical protein
MSAEITKTETKTEAKRDYFIKKLDEGYQITGKRSFDDLIKSCHDELGIPRGSTHDSKRILGKICQERKITFRVEKKSRGLEIKIEKTDRDPVKLAARTPQPTQTTQPTPTIDKNVVTTPTNQQQTTNETQQQKSNLPPLTEADLPRYKRKTNKIIKLGKKIYLKIGIITDEEAKQLEQEYTDLSEDIADYCIENNSRLPKQLELYLIFAQIAFLFGFPIFKWLFKPRKKDDKKKDDKKKEETQESKSEIQ